ncbi:PQQ-binding-like beta-propeller repeat protein [Salinigranum salinum]|uniref:PQQ-binding-like beta-propeller repeat protein n=1 Tax=Salinigranum salinum TaxID=1364937 RepID=UPI001260B8FF|nr:PQQ-binding-like beta-propeller repeat protein [Salinigranum salinum]
MQEVRIFGGPTGELIVGDGESGSIRSDIKAEYHTPVLLYYDPTGETRTIRTYLRLSDRDRSQQYMAEYVDDQDADLVASYKRAVTELIEQTEWTVNTAESESANQIVYDRLGVVDEGQTRDIDERLGQCVQKDDETKSLFNNREQFESFGFGVPDRRTAVVLFEVLRERYPDSSIAISGQENVRSIVDVDVLIVPKGKYERIAYTDRTWDEWRDRKYEIAKNDIETKLEQLATTVETSETTQSAAMARALTRAGLEEAIGIVARGDDETGPFVRKLKTNARFFTPYTVLAGVLVATVLTGAGNLLTDLRRTGEFTMPVARLRPYVSSIRFQSWLLVAVSGTISVLGLFVPPATAPAGPVLSRSGSNSQTTRATTEWGEDVRESGDEVVDALGQLREYADDDDVFASDRDQLLSSHVTVVDARTERRNAVGGAIVGAVGALAAGVAIFVGASEVARLAFSLLSTYWWTVLEVLTVVAVGIVGIRAAPHVRSGVTRLYRGVTSRPSGGVRIPGLSRGSSRGTSKNFSQFEAELEAGEKPKPSEYIHIVEEENFNWNVRKKVAYELRDRASKSEREKIDPVYDVGKLEDGEGQGQLDHYYQYLGGGHNEKIRKRAAKALSKLDQHHPVEQQRRINQILDTESRSHDTADTQPDSPETESGAETPGDQTHQTDTLAADRETSTETTPRQQQSARSVVPKSFGTAETEQPNPRRFAHYRGDAWRSGSNTSVGNAMEEPPAEGKPLVDLSHHKEVSSPVIADGRVFVTADRKLIECEIDTGACDDRTAEILQDRLLYSGPPTVVNDIVYAVTKGGRVVGVSTDDVVLNVELDGASPTTPAVRNGIAYVTYESDDGGAVAAVHPDWPESVVVSELQTPVTRPIATKDHVIVSHGTKVSVFDRNKPLRLLWTDSPNDGIQPLMGAAGHHDRGDLYVADSEYLYVYRSVSEGLSDPERSKFPGDEGTLFEPAVTRDYAVVAGGTDMLFRGMGSPESKSYDTRIVAPPVCTDDAIITVHNPGGGRGELRARSSFGNTTSWVKPVQGPVVGEPAVTRDCIAVLTTRGKIVLFTR